MMTNDGRRAPFRRHECAQNRRERRLRSEARLRLQLCRDAARAAAHRGGHDSRVMQKTLIDASTQTMDLFNIDTDDEDVAPAPVKEYVASAPVNEYVASAHVIEYVAPAPVTTLLEPPVPVVHVVQMPQVQVVQNTNETSQLQIIEKSVEFPATRSAQSAHTSVSLGTAPVSPMKPAEIIDVAGLGPPPPAESGPPMCASTPAIGVFSCGDGTCSTCSRG